MAALTLSTTKLPDAVVGEAYEASVAVQATGVAPLALSAGTTQTNKDALPTGLHYGTTGAHAGTIYGTPTDITQAGVLNLSVKVADNGGTNSVDNVAMTLNLNVRSAAVSAEVDATRNVALPLADALSRTGLGGTE